MMRGNPKALFAQGEAALRSGDLDFYAAHAFTVEPLRRHSLLPYPYPEGEDYPADAEHLRYQLDYNTRMGSDRMPPSLRYNYSLQH